MSRRFEDYARMANVASMFFEQADGLGDKPFVWGKHGKEWRSTSYGDAARRARRIAKGLRAAGLEKGDRVVVVSENRPEFIMLDMGIMAAGGITVPAYVTNTQENHEYILEHSGASMAIVSTGRLAQRLIPAARAVECCRVVVALEPHDLPMADGAEILSIEQLEARGEAVEGDPADWSAELGRKDVACFIYTSGTGGNPKGVMLSHGALLHNCAAAYDLLAEFGLGEEIFLSLLPLSHSYEHTAGLMFPVSIGAQIYYCPGADSLAQDLQEVRPTIMTAVPRLYEVLHDRIRKGVERAGGVQAKMFNLAVDAGRRRYHRTQTVGDRLLNPVLDKLVRKKVEGRFGGRLKAFVSGGGALNEDIGTFFIALGVRVLQGYGQTESAPVLSCNRPYSIKIHTVGPPLKDVEIRIAEDGEILARGEMVMNGYWREPDQTAATVIDGWLHTGDIGRLDEDGFLEITDRKKDIIVNSGGDNVAPARVEGFLAVEPEIGQAMVYGDKRPHLVGLVVPDQTFLEEWAKVNGKPADLAVLAHDEDFRKVITDAVDRANKKLSMLEKVRRVVIAEEPFTTDNGMMTPTLKIRRHVIKQAYAARLDALYGKH